MSSEIEEMDVFMTDGNGYYNEKDLEEILLPDSSQERWNLFILFVYNFLCENVTSL